MTKINCILMAALTGQVGGIATYGIEPLSMIIAQLAAAFMVVVGIYVYLYVGMWQKVAVTPIFLSCIIYLAYSLIPSFNPTESIDYICMLLESIGIIFIAGYFFTNRRGIYGNKETQKETHQEETHPTQEMRIVHMSKYR